METIKYVNISLEIFGCILSLFIIIFMKFGNHIKNDLHHKFIWILICNTIILCSDAIAWGFKGNEDIYSYIIIRIANFCVFSFGYILLILFTNYLFTFIASKTIVSKKFQYLIWGIMTFALILIIVSQFNDMFYIIDELNVYHRQNLFWLSQLGGILCMIINFCVLITYRKSLSKQELAVFISYILMPFIAMSIQMFLYGIALLYITTTVAVVIIYIGVQIDQAQLISEKELELAQSRITIMLSQIQPHFLYNSLTAIKSLCHSNPSMAEQAIVNFSNYLRRNLDSLTTDKLISFEQELSHIETYLSLEKMRFPEDLNIIYNIHSRNFLIPVLTVQPLIENAVRYGVCKKENGGTIILSTEEIHNQVIITIEDDGIGFDVNKTVNDGHAHIGIENVRSRLIAQCGGSLSIESRQGVGTIAKIAIPKGEIAYEYHSGR